ncbi:MAG: SapC family protein [Caldimicrobium sp.]
MLEPPKVFKKPALLEKSKHKDIKIKEPENFLFAKELEIVPLVFSELLEISMWYPVLFAVHEQKHIFPFAVLGVNQRNVYLNEEGFFKVEAIPKVLEHYPFGVIKKVKDDKEEWLVIVDEDFLEDEGERLFEENGEETPYLKDIKEKLTSLALDFQKAYEFSMELWKAGCLKVLPELHFTSKFGSCSFKNVLVGDVEGLRKISPEKLYYFNTIGYIPIFYSLYLSVRNFKLFDLFAK